MLSSLQAAGGSGGGSGNTVTGMTHAGGYGDQGDDMVSGLSSIQNQVCADSFVDKKLDTCTFVWVYFI